MPLLDPNKRRRVGGPYPPQEKPGQPEVMPVSQGDDEIDFGFPNDYSDREEDEGPPYEPDLDEHVEVAPAPVASQPKKLLKPLIKPAAVNESQCVTPAGAVPKATTGGGIRKINLSCHISLEHHRRLRVHCIKTGQSVLSIVEGWIEEHCPPL